MLDTFKARLKAKTKAAGVNLSTKRIDAYADRLHKKNPDVTDEAEHDTLIDGLDELVSFADIAKQDDQVRTLEAKVKSKQPAAPPKSEDNDDEEEEETEDNDDESGKPKAKKQETKAPKKKERVPAYVKDLMDKINSLVAEKAQSTIDSRIAALNKGEDGKPKVHEKFLSKRVKPEKLEDVQAWFEEAETDWQEISPVQSSDDKDKKSSGHQPKRGGKAPEKVDTKQIDALLDKMM